jgi:ornithine carbamoyltransferase
MFRLGGNTIYMNVSDTQLSRDETIEDTARVLSRYLDVLAVRTYSHQELEEMAKHSSIPVINALTDSYHPCQVLSDLMTVIERKGQIGNCKIAWVGDGNNVASSWINAASVLGFQLVLACPEGFEPPSKLLQSAPDNIKVVNNPLIAVNGADVINTDVWVSMGDGDDKKQKLSKFREFQVNRSLISKARADVIVMHCLPAHRGEEITDEVIDGPNSVVFDQAENKLYIHQAILENVLSR